MTLREYLQTTKFHPDFSRDGDWTFIKDVWRKISIGHNYKLQLYTGYGRECETISLDKDNFIVLDVALFKSLRVLETLSSQRDNDNQVYYYGFVVLIDFLIDNRHLDEAIMLKNWINHRILDKEFVLPQPGEFSDSLKIQLLFIFYHELAHTIINSGNFAAEHRNAIESVLSFYKYYGYGRYRKSVLDETTIIDEIKNDFARAHDLEAEKINFSEPDLNLELQLRTIDEIIHKDDFIDELICDDLAFEFLLDHEEFSRQDIAKSTFKTLNGLFFISALESMSKLHRPFSTHDDFFHRSTIRADFFASKYKVVNNGDVEIDIDAYRSDLQLNMGDKIVHRVAFTVQGLKAQLGLGDREANYAEIIAKLAVYKQL